HALSESQSVSQLRPHCCASISLAQTFSATFRSFASREANLAATSRLILPLMLRESTGIDGPRLERTRKQAKPIEKRARTRAKKVFLEGAVTDERSASSVSIGIQQFDRNRRGLARQHFRHQFAGDRSQAQTHHGVAGGDRQIPVTPRAAHVRQSVR